MSTDVYEDCRVAILCGGRGSRLKPTTDTIPKALVQLNGRPILDYVMNFYRSKGFERFVLCVGYKADMVREHCASLGYGSEVSFSDAGEDASMLGRIKALETETADRLMVSYCDTFIDLDLRSMLQQHTASGAEGTIVTARIRSPFGLVSYDRERVVESFVEKPLLNYYIGSFVLERSSLGRATEDTVRKPDGVGLVEFFQHLIAHGTLRAFEHEGPQITFNTESERQKAEEYIGQFYTYTESP